MQSIIQQNKTLQERLCAELCRKHQCTLMEALEINRTERQQKEIQEEESLIAMSEQNLQKTLEELAASTPRKLELTEKMKQYKEGDVQWAVIKKELDHITKLANDVKGRRLHLGKEKKRLEKLKNGEIGLHSKPASIENVKTWFKYGYYTDVWEGIEHWLPEFVSQPFVNP